MQIAWGTTRFVVLVGPFAIKFARLRITWLVKRLLTHLWLMRVRTPSLQAPRKPTAKKILFVGILGGPLANRREHLLWRTSPQNFMVPTLWSFLGIVNIQRRGHPVSAEELKEAHPFMGVLLAAPPHLVSDMTKPANFCRYNGQVCILDYGSSESFMLFWQPEPQPGIALA